MKKTAYLYLLASVLLNISCDDFLDTESKSKQTTQIVFETTFFTEASINGIYSTLTDSYVYGQKISTNWPTNSDIEIAGLSTDNYQSPTRDAGASNYYAFAENQNLRWDNLYKTVEYASEAVEGIRNSPLLETSDSTVMKAYLGEALTLRALGYLELLTHFGDIPFKHGPSKSDLSNVFIGKVDRDTVYKYIVQDLLEAEKYVPWLGGSVGKTSYGSADKITKGFIKGLAARAALFAGGWSIRDRNQFPETTAEVHPDIPEVNGYFTGRCKNWTEYYKIVTQKCAEIIGDSENPHRLDDFENLWKTINQLQYNSVNENLFEVAFGLSQNGDIGNLIGMRLDAGSKYGAISLGGGNVVSTAYYFYSFDQEDKRRDVTLSNISYTANDKENFNNNPTDWKFAKWRIYWMTDAYKSAHKAAASGRVPTGINWIVMRYSDVLLMFAEAQNELYGASTINNVAKISAKEALETVRKRAFGEGNAKITDYDSDFFTAVVNERAWEFGGEALRKYDLIRWGLLSEKIEEQKIALCNMFNGRKDVVIFGKTYPASYFPTRIYYKFISSPEEYIDRSSINYYGDVSEPGTGWYNTTWLSGAAVSGTNMKTWTTRVLIASTGLNVSYDYSQLVASMDSATSINDMLRQYPIGNGVCNNRHPFSIYNKNITDSRDILKNSYGY
jgi:hypothetical protein